MIEEISITVTPYLRHIPVRGGLLEGRAHSLGDARLHTLEIAVKANGRVFQHTLPVSEDDLTSRLDHYLDVAKEALRGAIKDAVKHEGK